MVPQHETVTQHQHPFKETAHKDTYTKFEIKYLVRVILLARLKVSDRYPKGLNFIYSTKTEMYITTTYQRSLTTLALTKELLWPNSGKKLK